MSLPISTYDEHFVKLYTYLCAAVLSLILVLYLDILEQ